MVKTEWNRRAMLAALPVALAACTTEDQELVLNSILGVAQGTSTSGGSYTRAEASQGIRTALIQGTRQAVDQVGRRGGYLNNNLIRIALPEDLARIQSQLAPFGLAGPLDTLAVELNRAAEEAAPGAVSIFGNAIQSMTITDAIAIVRGSDTAATDYFKGRTTNQLTALFRPSMESALTRVGAIRTFDNLVARVSAVPAAPQFADNAKRDLIDHAIGGGLNGLFYYVAVEEQAIRRDPLGQSQEILRKVFG